MVLEQIARRSQLPLGIGIDQHLEGESMESTVRADDDPVSSGKHIPCGRQQDLVELTSKRGEVCKRHRGRPGRSQKFHDTTFHGDLRGQVEGFCPVPSDGEQDRSVLVEDIKKERFVPVKNVSPERG